jgi:signal peptidase I
MKMRLFIQISVIVSIALIILLSLTLATDEQISPSNTIERSQIQVNETNIQINIEDAVLVSYNNTNSMDPILDEEANGIEIPVTDSTEIQIGDIVSYQADWNETLISHRIIDIEEDDQGIFYTLKGDNNSSADPGKVRIDQIQYKLIGVIY